MLFLVPKARSSSGYLPTISSVIIDAAARLIAQPGR